MTYHLSDGFVFQTKEAKMYFSKSIQKRSAVIPNPVFVDEKYIKKNYSGKINYIVSVGRLEKQKNYKMLIDAFAEIVSDIDNCRLTIYGEGSIRGELERYINEKGLIDKVLLPGRINNIHEKLMESDLFVLSSDYEGMSNALMEAMAIGLPCISTDCPIGGSAELIENHKNGLLVPVGDKDKLKEAIRHLVSNNNLASEMGENAKFIRKSNSLQQISDMWEGYLLDVVETRGNLK